MSLTTVDALHVLAALAALLVVAHLGGHAAARLGVPPMIGELAGGLLLGATVLERLWPAAHAWLLPSGREAGAPGAVVAPVLGFCSQIGLLLLMFLGGLQLRRLVTRKDAASVAWVASLGVLVPVAAGLALLEVVDVTPYLGSADHLGALKIVLLIELAITSIPVITRIFLDLDLMRSRLARIVLSVAVLEDVLLYVALSIALGMAGSEGKRDVSVPALLGLAPDSTAFLAWHVAASLLLLVVASVGFGRRRGARAAGRRLAGLVERSPLGWTLASILVVTMLAMLLGLAPMFGALVAGVVASGSTGPALTQARAQLEAVGSAFFVPLYFALIGTSLDLVASIDWRLTLGLLVVGTAVKYGGAALGARLAGEPAAMANAVAVSVNARGGPGLVVAAVASAAGIIDDRAYTSLVLLAVLTSVGAGVVLARTLRRAPGTAQLLRGRAAGPGRPSSRLSPACGRARTSCAGAA